MSGQLTTVSAMESLARVSDALFGGVLPLLRGSSGADPVAAKIEGLKENSAPSAETNELGGSQPSTSETEPELPIGEAQPEGEHVRSLRVFGSREGSQGSVKGEVTQQTPEQSRTVREVQVLRVFRDPDVMIAPGLITKSQCQHLLQLADGKWTRSKTSIGIATAPQTEYTTTESKTRTSKSVMLKESQTSGVTSVEMLACALAQLPIQHLEPLVLVRYDEGEYFNEHHDGAFRLKTVLLYLNDVEDGGFTHFTRLGLKIAPAAGCGAVWGNVTPKGAMDFRLLHAGAPPTKGTKYVVNCFFNQSAVRYAQLPQPLPALNKETQDPATTRDTTPASTENRAYHTSQTQHQTSSLTYAQAKVAPPNLQAWPLQTPRAYMPFGSPPQLTWGHAMLHMLQQLQPHGPTSPETPRFPLGPPKVALSPVGPPVAFACPADAWRGYAMPGTTPGRQWLHSGPPQGL